MNRETPGNKLEHAPGCRSALARLSWAAIGPLGMFALTVFIVKEGTGWVTVLDALFFLFAGLMIWGKRAEQSSGVATRFDGEPLTPDDYRRFVRRAVVTSSIIWVSANVVGNHVLAS